MPDSTEADEVTATLAERGGRYGEFRFHAAYAQALQDVMRSRNLGMPGAVCGWQNLPPDSKQALTVIADKIARILNGDPEYDDNWRDIAGYATLVLERIQGKR